MYLWFISYETIDLISFFASATNVTVGNVIRPYYCSFIAFSSFLIAELERCSDIFFKKHKLFYINLKIFILSKCSLKCFEGCFDAFYEIMSKSNVAFYQKMYGGGVIQGQITFLCPIKWKCYDKVS